MDKELKMGNRSIGDNHPVFVIAEAGVNHNGSLENAKRLIEIASESGSDAIKFQTFRANNLATQNSPKAAYQKSVTERGETQYDMLKKLEFTYDDFVVLRNYCDDLGIIFLSTPHDFQSIELLNELNVPAFKIGSGDLTNIPLIAKVSKSKKPILLSTGMSTLGEIEDAVVEIFANCNKDLVILHCVTSYPANYDECNLRAIETLKHAFNMVIGFSDHTMGELASCAAISLGARVIEKHLTLDINLPGPDHKASLDPSQFKSFVETIRHVETSLGDGVIRPTASEIENIDIVRKSVVAIKDISKGTIITDEMLSVKRPGTGIRPKFYEDLIGMTAQQDISSDEIIHWWMVR